MITTNIAFGLEMLAVCMTFTGLILILLDRNAETINYMRNTFTLVSKIQITMDENFEVIKATLTSTLATLGKVSLESTKILEFAQTKSQGMTAEEVAELVTLATEVKNAADGVDAIVADDFPGEVPVV